MKIENVNVKLTNVESVVAAITDVREKIAEMRESLTKLESAFWFMGVEINQSSDDAADRSD